MSDEAPLQGEEKEKNYSIGIDLGTTYSCVGVYKDGEVQIIANDQGNRTTPSYVAWTESERLLGDAAKNQVASNPTNTVFDAKRLIGRKFSDPIVQADVKLWPFKVVPDSSPEEKPLIEIIYQDVVKQFHPEDGVLGIGRGPRFGGSHGTLRLRGDAGSSLGQGKQFAASATQLGFPGSG